ncbi:alpha-N-arabinofuranosidase [Allosphingosinicella deserti]|uniref:non-reducing end alpha-L-arabinofuranosidase n=1 Tax=Allosphingosinicella deserti TaxID=2116704 RepID=A0A2P7R0E1_9SPHN|nr:alpha-N-arabinofuranosidase [Sphingomonas deserti]PSJ43666.1 alpha-N-arabinofuranosidase [Sphingomonas deserti]
MVRRMRRAALGCAAIALAAGMVASGPAYAQSAAARSTTVTVKADAPGARIDRRIFSQFAEHLGTGIYGGIWVGANSRIPNTRGYRNDVVAALRNLKVPVVRWPGGCFADEYHWREGIGPRNQRPTKVNTHWGGVTEPNSFGTHEFMDFAELIGAEAYVSGNVGNGTPQEMAEWVEYMTAPAGSLADLRAKNGRKQPWKLPFFGLGNELWGCGGNMTAEYAADLTRRYGTFVKAPQGTKIEKIASGANSVDYNWTEVMMREAGKTVDGIGVHYYTVPGTWEKKGPATNFSEEDYARTISKTLLMDELVRKHSAIMDKYDPAKRVNLAVDEWGTWYDVEPGTNPGFLYQQNTMRDAIVAALNINIFTHYADRVRMTNIAQMVNVLQAMILTDGPRMVLTPTYHVFEMYKGFQDATALPVEVASPWYNKEQFTVPAVSATAARDSTGAILIALVNVDPNQPASVSVDLGSATASVAEGRVLAGANIGAHNSFDAPTQVQPAPFTGAQIAGNRLSATLPAGSVVVLKLR